MCTLDRNRMDGRASRDSQKAVAPLLIDKGLHCDRGIKVSGQRTTSNLITALVLRSIRIRPRHVSPSSSDKHEVYTGLRYDSVVNACPDDPLPAASNSIQSYSTTNHPNPHHHVSRSSSHNHDEFLILTKSKPYASRSCTTITR